MYVPFWRSHCRCVLCNVYGLLIAYIQFFFDFRCIVGVPSYLILLLYFGMFFGILCDVYVDAFAIMCRCHAWYIHMWMEAHILFSIKFVCVYREPTHLLIAQKKFDARHKFCKYKPKNFNFTRIPGIHP